MGKTNRKQREQLAFNFTSDRAFSARVAGVINMFADNIRRKGPNAAARELGLVRVPPHWRKVGGR